MTGEQSSHSSAQSATSPSKKRRASDEPGDSDFESPTTKRHRGKGALTVTEIITTKETDTRDQRDRGSTKLAEVKETSLGTNESMLHGYPTRNRVAVRNAQQPLPNSLTPDPFNAHQNGDVNIDENTCELVKDAKRDDSSNDQIRRRHRKWLTDEGGVDSEVERGATHLWSMLQTADVSTSDVEDNATEVKQTSSKTPIDSSQSTLSSNTTSFNAFKSSFSSTVLDEPAVKLDEAFIPDRPPKSAKRLFIVNKSPAKTEPLLGTHSSPPKRIFRRQQLVRYDDPDATEDDYQPASTTPRRLHKSLTYPGLSEKDKLTIATAPKTPSKLCKTTGKPFDRSTTVRSTPRKRAPPLADFVSDQIAIPTSWAEVGEADNKLIQMKDKGCSWEAIRKMWKEMTGQGVAPSTLPNRYNRVKANLTVLQDSEVSRLRTFTLSSPF